jgi:hypothetical protein
LAITVQKWVAMANVNKAILNMRIEDWHLWLPLYTPYNKCKHRNIRTIKTLNPTIRSPETHSAKILFPHLGVDPHDLLAPALSIATSPLAITGRNQKAPIFGTRTTGDKRKYRTYALTRGFPRIRVFVLG